MVPVGSVRITFKIRVRVRVSDFQIFVFTQWYTSHPKGDPSNNDLTQRSTKKERTATLRELGIHEESIAHFAYETYEHIFYG